MLFFNSRKNRAFDTAIIVIVFCFYPLSLALDESREPERWDSPERAVESPKEARIVSS